MSSTPDETIPYSQFICIGTGFSGIGLGATLQRWYGITDVRFFEREAEIGGTWFLNSYPGAAADIPNLLYCFSYEPNITWSKLLPGRDELLAYLRGVADKYNIPSRTSFRSQVFRCEWLEDRKRWRVHVKNLKTGVVSLHESQFLFSATGILDQPREPDLPGLSTFTGPVFHTARWRHDIDLRDKSVVVFGNGCTGTQLMPVLAPKVRQVTQFVRSKHWIVPSMQAKTIEGLKSIYRNFPGGMRLVRFILYLGAEDDFTGIHMNEKGSAWRAKKTEKMRRFIQETAPEKYHDMLIPDFEFGCKRRVFNAGYLESLYRDNVTVTNERPQEVKSDHIVTSGGNIVKADAIVFANGFKTERVLEGVDVIGRTQTLEEHWDDLGGPGAYNTLALSGFPNFFIIVGPNAATSHTSAIMASENTVNLALRQIKPVLDGRATTVEVTQAAEEEHVQQLQHDLSTRVWASGCNGWYVTKDEEGRPAWNATLWPYSQANLWYRSLFPTKSHWQYTGTRPSFAPSLGVVLCGIIVAAIFSLVTVGGGKNLFSLDSLQSWHRKMTMSPT